MAACKHDDHEPMPIDPVIQEAETFFNFSMNGQSFDSIIMNCNKGFTSLNIEWIDTDSSFIFRQGPEFVKINDSIKLTCLIIIYDKTRSYTIYTPEVFGYYFDQAQENVSLDLELKVGDFVYKNQWYIDWEIHEYLVREIVDPNAIYEFKALERIEPHCTETWPILPVQIKYSGLMSTEDGAHTIAINSFEAQVYLAEAF